MSKPETTRQIAWEIADKFCDKSAGVYRLRNAIERAILTERERCAHIALAIDSKRGNEKEIARTIRAQT